MELNELLTKESHDEGAEVQIYNPANGEDTDVYITVMGVDSQEWQKAMKRQRNRTIAKLADKKELTEEDEITEEIEQLVAVTKGWRGIAKNGKVHKFSPEACKKLYTESPGLRQQVERFVTNRKNFTKG